MKNEGVEMPPKYEELVSRYHRSRHWGYTDSASFSTTSSSSYYLLL